MAKLSKEERKSRIKRWQAVERTELVASMPLSPQQLNSLLDYLDTNLKTCDHTTKLTDIFLHCEQLDKQRVLPWLADHGGYCDCEVLHNLDDLAESLCDRPVPSITISKEQIAARDLMTKTGWNLETLPQPWRIANRYAPEEPLQIQMGKKGGCNITIIEAAMPAGDQQFDDYWSRLWYARTKLPKKSPIRVSHAALDLPNQLRSTLVQSSGWIPVYCWIVSDDHEWYLEVRTESNRQQGDLPKVAQLVNKLVYDKA